MILTLKATEGKGWSDKDIEKALVQGLVVASSVTELQHNIHNEHATAVYFFGKDSFLAKQLAVSRDHVRDNLQVYEALQAKDSSFVAKVLFSYSVRTDNWFRQCMKEQDRSKVDDSLLDFPEDHRAILNRRFDITLPVCIHPFKAAAEKPRSGESPVAQNKQPNKRPKQGSVSVTPELGVTNPKPRADWKLKEGESFRKVFIGKPKPKWEAGDCRWCAKYHTRCWCFPDCPNAASHIPSTELTSKDKPHEYLAYVKSCRE
jgi:hypothetical protein